MDGYSTVLWHLRRAPKLAYLAHELTQIDRLAPETWCAVGNCFSLLKEHDKALAFFRRALQLDPSYSCAHTLSGHEYVANDDLEQGVTQYRRALRCDARNYKAWYGLGMIFYRTQRLPLADYHFQRALAINARSSALHSYRGMVLNKQKKWDEANKELDRAVELNPNNVLAKSKKAQVAINQGDLDKGLELVNHVLTITPRESFLHFLKGTIYAKKRDKTSALMHFTNALDLDSKNSALIKTHIERIYSSAGILPGHREGASEGDEEFDIMG